MRVLLDSDSSARREEFVATMRVKLEANGRVLLPAEVRRQLGVSPGDTLLLDVDESGIHLWTQAMAIRALQEAVAAQVPAGVSLVDELLQMRRVEAARLHAVDSTPLPRVRRGTK